MAARRDRSDDRLHHRLAAGQSGQAGADPGDPERRTRAERLANGVPVDDETWRELVEAARGINVLVELARPSTPSNA
jgi:LDH2 family malate/lactate/ureidoglycolate dehydrogenase